MRHRRLLVLAILVYVTLDLSLPAMPGAFVFEHADSAESTQVRARAAAETVALPALARDPGSVLSQPLEGDERLAPASSAERRGRPVRTWSFLPHVDPTPPSEDPH